MASRIKEPKQFTVSGRGTFPIDMLRYDRAYPASEQEAGKIERSFQRGQTGMYNVTLKTSDPTAPTVGRWESFNFNVVT